MIVGKFKCSTCGEDFIKYFSSESRKAHFTKRTKHFCKKQHSFIKTYICNWCKKEFIKKFNFPSGQNYYDKKENIVHVHVELNIEIQFALVE